MWAAPGTGRRGGASKGAGLAFYNQSKEQEQKEAEFGLSDRFVVPPIYVFIG